MAEKDKITEELEQEVEKALESIFSAAKKTELKEEEIEGYSLLEPIVEGEEALKKEFEELIGEILTIEWEIIPEITEKAYQKCQKLRAAELDRTNQKLLEFLEKILEEIRSPEKIEALHLDLLKKTGSLLYQYNFEGLAQEKVLHELKELEKTLEKEKEELKLELEVETEEKPLPEISETPQEVLHVEDHPPLSPEVEPIPEPPRPSAPPPKRKEMPEDHLLQQLLRTYERLVAIEALLKQGALKGSRKLLLKAQKEIREILGEKYQEELERREREILAFLEKQEKEKVPALERALWCRTLSRELLIPLEEVAFYGEIQDHWRKSLSEGLFPLKLLKGRGLFSRWFGKIRPKLQGELAQKPEKELEGLTFKTNKLLTTETKLVLLWKEGQGLALLANDYKIIQVDPNIEWLPANPPFLGRALMNGTEIYIFSVTRL
ncbi:hypothetical protein FVE67_07870 [Thermosulfurimonas marina]|uniref:Uncharacterized protein n=1 Tax=Thermosulfurimonas marina TaxID=2047767 RepID=A0A6H1WU86_9BACT|nr:hypothetical protein [Thermosulfurimonas marina]QJA06714.1 hypothetical protein FVE67_07870 [Thermosulfurimonas marina]